MAPFTQWTETPSPESWLELVEPSSQTLFVLSHIPSQARASMPPCDEPTTFQSAWGIWFSATWTSSPPIWLRIQVS